MSSPGVGALAGRFGWARVGEDGIDDVTLDLRGPRFWLRRGTTGPWGTYFTSYRGVAALAEQNLTLTARERASATFSRNDAEPEEQVTPCAAVFRARTRGRAEVSLVLDGCRYALRRDE